MKITIMDYGVGNLHSIAKGLGRAGASIEVVEDPNLLLDAEGIVFPGVGAFGAAMRVLEPVIPELRESITAGKPVLGVCLGMQILFQKSEESPGDGLGVLKGTVRKIKGERIPHMGWNDVVSMGDTLFLNILNGTQFYFANSYVCRPEEDVTVAVTDYGGMFPSAVRKGKICGVQFHPEKSGPAGLTLLRSFIRIAEGDS